MFVLAIAASVIQAPQSGWVAQLGKERSQYGDIPNSGKWKYVDTSQFGGTYMLFRIGSSTERYYSSGTSGTGRRRISRTTRIGKRIRKDWMIELVKGPETKIEGPGTLWDYSLKGWKVVGKIPAAARKDLQNPEPLVLYRSTIHSSYCQVIYAGGSESNSEQWQATTVTNQGSTTISDGSLLPRTRAPYTIPHAEYDYLVKSKRRPRINGL